MAKNGLSFADIGKRLNLSRERIRQICNKRGFTAQTFKDVRHIIKHLYKCCNCKNVFLHGVRPGIYKKYFCAFKCYRAFIKKHGFKDKSPRWSSGRKRYKGRSFKINNYWQSQTMHRIIMEKFLGRPLNKHECVHHINGNSCDNRLENLKLISSSTHSSNNSKRFHSTWKKALVLEYIGKAQIRRCDISKFPLSLDKLDKMSLLIIK